MQRHSRPAYDKAEGARLRTANPSRAGPFLFYPLVSGAGTEFDDDTLDAIARAMTRPSRRRDSGIPAGFTFLGQFVAHDLSFLDQPRLRDEDNLSWRSPSLDLDCLHARGPGFRKELYERAKLKTDTTAADPEFPADPIAGQPRAGFDLPRQKKPKRALIPDQRNDENLGVAQTHLAITRFYNRVVDKLEAEGVRAQDPQSQFEEARRVVVLHYQWMLRHDFLPRLIDKAQLDDVFCGRGRKIVEPDLGPDDPATMPLEFSAAAFRFGHSMVREAYDWNRADPGGGMTLEGLFKFSGTAGGLDKERPLPTSRIADFRRLYDFREAGRDDLHPGPGRLNVASRIDTRLVVPLSKLPTGLIGDDQLGPERGLAFRNLKRAQELFLATGQKMAEKMLGEGLGIVPLERSQILTAEDGADLSGLSASQQGVVAANTPLWFYVLREAELNHGRMTGVGGRLVAETFHRCMECSTDSILREPHWRPSLGRDANTFDMVDLLLFAFEGREDLLNPLGD